jgi:hypothetical protein
MDMRFGTWKVRSQYRAGKVCGTNGAEEECIRILVGKPEGKRPLGRPRRRRVDNIKMDLRKID